MVIRELTLNSIVIRVILSIVVGGIIGIERGMKNQAAGARTYMLVCMGAALVMMTNQYMCTVFETGDPSRLGAQVVSGIGFLGAGSIIVTKNNHIRGLTTAAGLWSSACVGLAIGIGFYEGASIVGIAIFLIMTVFRKIDMLIKSNSNYIRLYISFDSIDYMNEFLNYCKERNIKILDMEISKPEVNDSDNILAFFSLQNSYQQKHVEMIAELCKLDCVKHIEEI